MASSRCDWPALKPKVEMYRGSSDNSKTTLVNFKFLFAVFANANLHICGSEAISVLLQYHQELGVNLICDSSMSAFNHIAAFIG
jgi:hypothetical protein